MSEKFFKDLFHRVASLIYTERERTADALIHYFDMQKVDQDTLPPIVQCILSQAYPQERISRFIYVYANPELSKFITAVDFQYPIGDRICFTDLDPEGNVAEFIELNKQAIIEAGTYDEEAIPYLPSLSSMLQREKATSYGFVTYTQIQTPQGDQGYFAYHQEILG